jgi:hypothetical protein
VLWSAIIVLWSAPRGWVESDGSIGKKGLGARRAFVGAFLADAGPSAFAVGMLRDFFKKNDRPVGRRSMPGPKQGACILNNENVYISKQVCVHAKQWGTGMLSSGDRLYPC